MGIDYGKKRVGIALSDETGTIAMPYIVLKNNEELIKNIKEICIERDVQKIVIGLSLDFKGRPNFIVSDTDELKRNLEEELKISVVYEPEVLTTVEAGRLQGKIKNIDASAAAIILKSFIEKQKNDII